MDFFCDRESKKVLHDEQTDMRDIVLNFTSRMPSFMQSGFKGNLLTNRNPN